MNGDVVPPLLDDGPYSQVSLAGGYTCATRDATVTCAGAIARF